jgi:hypothetical protein
MYYSPQPLHCLYRNRRITIRRVISIVVVIFASIGFIFISVINHRCSARYA